MGHEKHMVFFIGFKLKRPFWPNVKSYI
jgi:hypothetical protein